MGTAQSTLTDIMGKAAVSNEQASGQGETRTDHDTRNEDREGTTVPSVGDKVEDCIVLDIHGDWAHFARPNTRSPALTYAVPPRTTVAGLLAAIQGYDRDSYYHLFHPDHSDIAVSVQSPVQRFTMPINYLDTEGSNAKTVGAKPGKHITANRQQVAVEYLRDPTYRVYVSVDSPEFMDTLTDRVTNNRPYYPPSLGKSECIASVDFLGRFEMTHTTGEHVSVDSTVPGESPPLTIEGGKNYVSDRFPANFHINDDGDRNPERWHTLTFDAAGDPVTLRECEYTVVNDDHVIFD